MIRFEDASPEFVRQVFTHPDIWPSLCDDSFSDPALYEPVDSPLVRYIVPADENGPLGVLMLVQQNAVVVELHTALLPDKRGQFTKAVFDALLSYLKATYPQATRLRTWVPAYNRPAYVAAKRVGFALVGTEPSAYLKDGAVCDLHLFGVSL